MTHELGQLFVCQIFSKIFSEEVVRIKNISTFADPFAEAGAETR
jgi:hypothetical protein